LRDKATVAFFATNADIAVNQQFWLFYG
jgi:hypothetical protein